jgi:hypothetical protein
VGLKSRPFKAKTVAKNKNQMTKITTKTLAKTKKQVVPIRRILPVFADEL